MINGQLWNPSKLLNWSEELRSGPNSASFCSSASSWLHVCLPPCCRSHGDKPRHSWERPAVSPHSKTETSSEGEVYELKFAQEKKKGKVCLPHFNVLPAAWSGLFLLDLPPPPRPPPRPPPPPECKPCPDKSLPQPGNLHTGAAHWRGSGPIGAGWTGTWSDTRI